MELVVRATLIRPLPVTSGVMSTEVWPALTAPEVAVIPEGAGAFWYVIVVSPQLLSATPRTS